MLKSCNLLLLLTVIFLFTSCNQEKKQEAEKSHKHVEASEEKQPVIDFEKTSHDFGTVFRGEKVTYSFRFKNTGQAPLLITGTRSGCGCTVGEYPEEPVNPGESAYVDVIFNSSGKQGFQSESIRIFTNAQPANHLLKITAEVVGN